MTIPVPRETGRFAAEGKYAWRIGRKVPINVYEGDRPVCQCQTALDAKKIVAAVNAAMRQDPATPAPSQPAAAREIAKELVDAGREFLALNGYYERSDALWHHETDVVAPVVNLRQENERLKGALSSSPAQEPHGK